MTGPAQSPHLPHSAQELKGKPGIALDMPEDVDLSADTLIRKVMVAQKREANQDVLPDILPSDDAAETKPIRHPRKLFKLRRKDRSETPKPKTPKPKGAVKPNQDAPKARPPAWLKPVVKSVANFRPTPKQMFFVAVAVIFYLRPWLIPITFLLTFLTVLIGYLSLGPDRVAELVVTNWRRLHARKPEFAENLRARAEAMAIRIDAFLDRLPEKWTDGLYVPDFSRSDQKDADLPDPFERLAREAQQSGT